MAKPSDKAIEYRTRATRLRWADLATLWNQIKAGSTPEWDPGKAFEHLVIRAFELNKLQVEYPFDVPPEGETIEQIDGMVYLGEIGFLIECKDRAVADILTIAKLSHQLQRRPPTAMGCVFVTGRFTRSALTLAQFALPHRILLWSELDIEYAMVKRDFAGMLKGKHRELQMYGMTDQASIHEGFPKMTGARELTMVLEDVDAVAILRALYGEIGGKKTRFYSGDKRILLATLARNILVHEGAPVLVVMDAETYNLDRAEEDRGLTAFLVQQFARPGDFDVHTFVPALEVIFFEAPEFLERALGQKISAATLREGKLIPKETLKSLFNSNGNKSYAERLAAAINADTARLLLAGPQAKQLNGRIQSLIQAPKLATSAI